MAAMQDYGPHTYGDSFADVYDLWYPEVSDAAATVDALVALAAGRPEPVLELGIGSGRLALPLAERGVAVWGIDASAAMVERLRAKPGGATLPVALGDMATLDLASLPGGAEARFCVVFAAYNTLFNLTTMAAQERCLRRVAEVLAPGGVLVVEAFVPPDGADGTEDAVSLRTLEVDRVVLSVSRHRPDHQVIEGQAIELTSGGIRLRPWMVRYAPVAELDRLAWSAGLRLRHRHGGWRDEPFAATSSVHVSVYEPR
jgi:SAM-dependent methyltransferase